MTACLLILNDPPYGTERSYNGLRLAGSLARAESNQVRVFLMGDAAACAKPDQKPPKGYYNLEVMLGSIARRGGEIGGVAPAWTPAGSRTASSSRAAGEAAWMTSPPGRWRPTGCWCSERDSEGRRSRRKVMNQTSQTILVLGGGVGGLVAAVELRKKLPKPHRIVLVDREERHLFAPSLLWLMTGLRTADNISRALDSLKKKGIEVIRGEIKKIDPASRQAVANGTTLTGDHLVISLGAQLAPETIPGLAEAGHDFYSLSGAESLRDALETFRSGRLVVLTAAPAYKCPAAPYEAAMLLEYDCRKRKVRDAVQIDLYAAEPGPMGVAGPDVSAGVRQMVEQKGIGYHPDHQVTAVDPNGRRLSFANGASADFDLLAYVPPHRPPRVVQDAELVGESGWVPVNRHTLETRFDRVYAIGDVTGIPLALGKPLPKAGVFAHGEAEVVAQNIARAITGKGKRASFDGYGECFIETGNGKAGFGRGNFYAEPLPDVKLKKVARRWHWSKVLFEKRWLRQWF